MEDLLFTDRLSLGIMGGVLGLILGSFLSVVIPRLHSNESGILWGRSACPNCKHVLTAKELIPLLSFCLQKGACKNCQKKIPLFHPILELSSGLLLSAVWIHSANLSDALVMTPIILTGIYIFASDTLFQEIHDAVLIPSLIYTGLVSWLWFHQGADALSGAAIGGAFFAIQYLLSKGRFVGSGDILIGLWMGLWLTHWQILYALLTGYMLGSALGILLILSKKATRQTAIPLGPFLTLGTFIVYFY